ncbi:MAG: hypothetical protein IPI93_04010 [Sphingobacteriaceae bacterium]|nr:hypothetical protein [Sphingobacteriaceae bacterium]MBK7818099.1 hypothetical protein [Sphingobacteriaceae bacterium]
MKKAAALCVIILLFTLCKKDFIVEDIEDKTITVNAPVNNLVTTNNKITFWWEALDGAEKYNIQIVKPSFASITEIISDTNIVGTKYSLTLQPGTYQWRIRATNAGGSTAYQTFNLKVDTTSNLSSLSVSTIDPPANWLTGNKRVSFSWNSLNAADSYQIILLNSTNGTIKDTTTALTTYTYTFPSQGSYSWKVRALNDFSISQYNAALSFTIDQTSPSAPILTLPSHGSIVTPTNSLFWNRIGAPDAKYDSIYVATDSAFTNIISYTKAYTQSITINMLSSSPPATGSFYWWKLRSVDSVGNRSVFSNQLKFKLNP